MAPHFIFFFATHLKARPRRSRTVSGLPRFPAIVENRAVTGVRLPMVLNTFAMLWFMATPVVTSNQP